MRTPFRIGTWVLILVGLAGLAADARAQDANILMAVDSVEVLLASGSFEIVDRRGSRFEGDRTSRIAMSYPDGTMLAAQWARAAPGGEAFNNVPRFELAAYELQKLFLDESEFVVPPTVIRAFPLDWYQELEPRTRATFQGTGSVLVVLQYWLFNVTPEGVWDADRFEADSVYARHFGNFNLMTRLLYHGDENMGNYLISLAEDNPRVFSVDNGITFSSKESDRGHYWRRLRVDRLPAATVARLRTVTREDLVRQLETVAEFRIRDDGTLEAVEPGPNIHSSRGVRRAGDRIQLGLTRREISDVWRRVTQIIGDLDRGRIGVF